MKSNKIVIRWILISNEEKGRLKPFLDLLHSFCNDLYRNHFHVKEPRLIREFLSLSFYAKYRRFFFLFASIHFCDVFFVINRKSFRDHHLFFVRAETAGKFN